MILYQHHPGETRALVQFFRQECGKLRSLTKVVISAEKTTVYDVNGETMEFQGLTFGDPALEALLDELGVIYDTDVLRKLGRDRRTVEYPVSARYPWGWDRVGG